MTDAPNPLAGFLAAVLDTAYRPHRHPEPEPEAAIPAADRHRERLRRMLHDALHPAQQEPTWAKHFQTSTGIAAELLDQPRTDTP